MHQGKFYSRESSGTMSNAKGMGIFIQTHLSSSASFSIEVPVCIVCILKTWLLLCLS